MAGELIDQFEVGTLAVRVTKSCARRDLYDARAPGPLPLALRDVLAARGSLAGNDALWIVDVPGVHRITVSAATGRIVILPRMEPERPAQRAAVMELLAYVDEQLAR